MCFNCISSVDLGKLCVYYNFIIIHHTGFLLFVTFFCLIILVDYMYLPLRFVGMRVGKENGCH